MGFFIKCKKKKLYMEKYYVDIFFNESKPGMEIH